MKIDIPCVILAGGKSSRMGEDKCFLPFKNTTLIKYQYDRLSKIFTNVYISSKVNKFDFDVNLILEKNNIYSPMVALENIIKTLNNRFFLIPVDTPNLTKQSILTMIDKSYKYDITIAKTNDNINHNLCGVFSNNLKNQIQNMLKDNNHKIGYLIKHSSFTTVLIDNKTELLNLNNKEDYLNFLSYL